MAQPMATSKRIKTSETNWPLRAHPQEHRQDVVTKFFPFSIASGASTGAALCSVTVSIPFDVKAIRVDANATNISFSGASKTYPAYGIGITELEPYFGQVLHSITPGSGGGLGSSRHEFMRPVPMQGQRLTFNLYNPPSSGTTSGAWAAASADSVSVDTGIVVRIEFIRQP